MSERRPLSRPALMMSDLVVDIVAPARPTHDAETTLPRDCRADGAPCAAIAVEIIHVDEQIGIEAPASIDQKGKRRRRKSAHRDARYHLAAQGLQAEPDLLDQGATSVTTPASPFFSSKAVRTWKSAEQIVVVSKRHRRPALWRDLDDLARETFWNRAIAVQGGISFTVNFSREEEAEIRAAPSAVDRIRRRFAYHLQSILGFVPDYWFRLESTFGKGGRLHLHGAIVLNRAGRRLLVNARRALRRAAGEWNIARQHQVRFGLGELNDGWATYAYKDWVRNRQSGFVDRLGLRHYSGPPSYATGGLKKRARALYEEQRETLLDRNA